MNSKMLHTVAFTLLVVGGLNWLLVGLFGFDLVMYIGMYLGTMMEPFVRIVYIAVGLSAIYEFATHKSNCRMCN